MQSSCKRRSVCLRMLCVGVLMFSLVAPFGVFQPHTAWADDEKPAVEQGFEKLVYFEAAADDQLDEALVRAVANAVLERGFASLDVAGFDTWDVSRRSEIIQSAQSSQSREAWDGATAQEQSIAYAVALAVVEQQETVTYLHDQGISFRGTWAANTLVATLSGEQQAIIESLPFVDQVADNVIVDNEETTSARSRRAIDEREVEENLRAIRADKVWDDLGLDGTGVVVGLVDEAVDLDHPSLYKKFYGFNAESGSITNYGYYHDVVGDGTVESDSHGTHVAGIMVGSEDRSAQDGSTERVNRIGVAPGAHFVASRAFRTRVGASNERIIQACQWMMMPNNDPAAAPRVVNHSWTDGTNVPNPWFDDMLTQMRNAGIVNVMSSGNSSGTTARPGSIDNPATSNKVISVGATDNTGKLASFSRRGPAPNGSVKPDLVAPGVGVRSAVPHGSYASWNGTSMAAPEVSGVIALMLQANPNLTVDQVRRILIDTAHPLTDATYTNIPNNGYGAGMVDAYAAVTRVLELAGASTPQHATHEIQGSVSAPVASLSESEQQSITQTLPKTAYVDRSLKIRVHTDNPDQIVGVRTTIARGASDRSPKTYDAKHRSGSRDFVITVPARDLSFESLSGVSELLVSSVATDTSGHQYVTSQHAISVAQAVTPEAYSFNLEEPTSGFDVTGAFAFARANTQVDPRPVSGEGIIGTTPGSAIIGNDRQSMIVFPRIDLRAYHPGDGQRVVLRYKEWADYEQAVFGVQATPIQENGEAGRNVNFLNYPVTLSEDWTTREFDLDAYKGSVLEVFAFNLNRAQTQSGRGLYIDDVVVSVNDATAPAASVSTTQTFEPKAATDTEFTIANARVELIDTGMVTYTSTDGSFHFYKVPAGQYTIRVGAPGYESVDTSISIPSSGDPLHISLTRSAEKPAEDPSNPTGSFAPTSPLREIAWDNNNPLAGGHVFRRTGNGFALKIPLTADERLASVAFYAAGNNPAFVPGNMGFQIKAINEYGRLINVGEKRTISVTPGQWNSIPVTESVRPTKDTIYYAVITQESPSGETPAIALDASVRPNTYHADRIQFYTGGTDYEGALEPLREHGIVYAPMIRAYVESPHVDASATLPTAPEFSSAIDVTKGPGVIEHEGQEPADIVTIDGWRISPSQGAVYGYEGLEELYNAPENTAVLDIPATIGGVHITSIASEAFAKEYGVGKLARVVIPEGVTEINESAFANAGMQELVLPRSLETIYASAFTNARIRSIDLPHGLRHIGESAFEGANSLERLIVPDSVETIERNAFKKAYHLSELVLPRNPRYTEISLGCFSEAWDLTSVEIPSSVKTIKANAFREAGLTSVVIPEGVTHVGEAAFRENALTSVTLPSSLVEIDDEAFRQNSISRLVMPEGVQKIGDAAFKNNRITHVLLPESVTFVNWEAFANNPLEVVQLNSTIMPRPSVGQRVGLTEDAFDPNTAHVYYYTEEQLGSSIRSHLDGGSATEYHRITDPNQETISLPTHIQGIEAQITSRFAQGVTEVRFTVLDDAASVQATTDWLNRSVDHARDIELVGPVRVSFVNGLGEEVLPLGPVRITISRSAFTGLVKQTSALAPARGGSLFYTGLDLQNWAPAETIQQSQSENFSLSITSPTLVMLAKRSASDAPVVEGIDYGVDVRPTLPEPPASVITPVVPGGGSQPGGGFQPSFGGGGGGSQGSTGATSWITDGTSWYLAQSHGQKLSGWQVHEGSWYYLDPSTKALQTGWLYDQGTWYYLGSSGAMQTGWISHNGTWYYLNGSGAMQTGWLSYEGIWYYLTDSGAMARGWEQVAGTWYYFDHSGAMQTGWISLQGYWYYLDESGAMQTGWVSHNGKWYWCDSQGRMTVGTQWIGSRYYTFDRSGVLV